MEINMMNFAHCEHITSTQQNKIKQANAQGHSNFIVRGTICLT